MNGSLISKIVLMIFLSILFLFQHFNVRAATVQANSCSSSDVQTAINAAKNNDIVLVPAGNCTWTSSVIMDVSAKSLQVRGAGMDATKITASVENAIAIIGEEGYYWALSDMQFLGGTGNAIISITGTSKSWRLHHIKFSTTGGPNRLINVSGYTYGVIDHCEAIGTTPSEFVTVDGDDWPMWGRPQSFGDANAVYIEDNIISWTGHWEGRPVLDGQRGGRAVFRHNQVTNSIVFVHGYDTGGTASMMSLEVYNNEFIITDTMSTWAMLGGMRGGTGLWFNNKWTLGSNLWLSNSNIQLAIYRAGDGPYGWKYGCDGTEIKMCSNIDKDWRFLGGTRVQDCITDNDCPTGYYCKWKFCSVSKMILCEKNEDCPTGESCSGFVDGPKPDGYPCRHQPGFSTHMRSEPIYGWNNTFTGSQKKSGVVTFMSTVPQLQEGRDYFNNTPKPGYQPYFYPHPLTIGDISPPNPPSNLRISQ
ncbi:MAG: dickkopf-related protein [Methanomassiliicoccales archaeon]